MPEPISVALATWAAMGIASKLAWNGMRKVFGTKQPKTNPVMDELERRANSQRDELSQAKKDIDDLNEQVKLGIQPQVHPTREEIARIKRERQYDPHNIHFAIAGNSGGGKSSLINAFRGIANNYRGPIRRAETGEVETTKTIGRYPMSEISPDDRRVWYDVPGAGTLSIPEWQYFNSQGLFIFDAIIVVFDNRFTQTDLAILEHAARFNIPSFIVRSKSDGHIENVLKNMEGYPEDDDDEDFRAQYLPHAYNQYVVRSRQNVTENLRKWQASRQGRQDTPRLVDKRVYLVSKGTLVALVNEKPLGKRMVLDERALLEDLTTVILTRRF